jgi:rhamnogalacturonan endolyase
MVVASISDLNYRGSSSATLVVAPSTAAVIVLGNLTQVYDGMPKPVTATTTPAGLTTTITYGGSTTAPTMPGTYPVVASISNPNYLATVTGSLVISVTALVRHAPTLEGDIEGSVQVLTGESLALNGNASVSGDILVPGLPTVRLNGQPTFVSMKDGTGSATPSNYQVTLNGRAVLRYLVRRVDPIAMPTVSAPPTPAGTRDVEITTAGQTLGNLATLRNVVLNNKAGTITLPAGTYGTLTADGSTAVQLGVAGATTPSVYHLPGLTMNGKSQLKVVGPVVLVLARSATIDGEVIAAGSPAWLTLGVASGGVTLNGNVSFIGTIVAPNGTVTINGNASLNGSVIADRLTVNGNGLLKQGTP